MQTKSVSVNFGAAKSGLYSVGYTLYTSAGVLQQARTITGVYEVQSSTGIYGAFISFEDNWSGFILWDTGEATPVYAVESYGGNVSAVNFGKAYAGISTAGFKLVSSDGTEKQSRTTTGVVEVGSSTGIFGASVTFETGWQGTVVWDSGTMPNKYASDDYNGTSTVSTVTTSGTFTYNVSTNLGKVRMMIGDTDSTTALLTDEEINAFLSMNGNDLYATASACLYRIASSKALVAKRISAGNYSEDTSGMAAELRATAKEYKAMSDSVPAEAQAEIIWNEMSYNSVIARRDLRGETE